KTQTQTNKSRTERYENVSGKFKVHKEEEIINKHILLIDDVITTGATIEACAEELLKTEGIKVSIAALAYAAKR
ncbi:MAG: ComF family protein, partial [Bacteroidetes bacterium]|nr:ComF family protein [Bacteroidota bacterium]